MNLKGNLLNALSALLKGSGRSALYTFKLSMSSSIAKSFSPSGRPPTAMGRPRSPLSLIFSGEPSPAKESAEIDDIQLMSERVKLRRMIKESPYRTEAQKKLNDEAFSIQKEIRAVNDFLGVVNDQISDLDAEYKALKDKMAERSKMKKLIKKLEKNEAELVQKKENLERKYAERAQREQNEINDRERAALEAIKKESEEIEEELKLVVKLTASFKDDSSNTFIKSPISPRKSSYEALRSELWSVKKEIDVLRSRCNTMEEYVAFRSPERIRKIKEEERRAPLTPRKSPQRRRTLL